ncbi:MAG: hypothetical protein IK152_01365 [Lachnospiraceae bacterium]|nr:hypothetical protein [Lachnospiraceae bacterium]
MNRVKKTLALILASFLALSMMAGCAGGGNTGSSAAVSSAAGSSVAVSSAAVSSAAASSTVAAKEIKATDYVLGFHKYLCTGDKKIADDLKLPEDFVKEMDKARSEMDNITELLKESVDADTSKLIDDKSIADFAKAFSGLLSKVSATATEESTKGDVVTVKLSSDTIDMSTIGQNVLVSAFAGFDSKGGDEQVKKLMEKIFSSFTEELNKYEFPKEKGSCTVEVKKKGDSWEFADSEKAMTDITGVIIKMDYQ